MLQPSQSLAERAYDIVEALIVTLDLPPGTVFSEGELSERIGIGRTPLREALLRLAGDRLVVSLPRKGMMVTEINVSDYLALLDTRRVLDRLIAMRAAQRATPAERERLQDCVIAMQQAVATGNLAEFMRLDRECDEILEAASRNTYAVQAVEPLHAHCRRFWYMHRHNGDLAQSASLHGQMIEAVVKGDPDAAGAASDLLISYLEQFTREALHLV